MKIKYYPFSKRATLRMKIGGIFKLSSYFFMFLGALVAIVNVFDEAEEPMSEIIGVVGFLLFIGIILYLIGRTFKKSADEFARNQLELKARLNFEFTKKMALRYPHLKEWFMGLNAEYHSYVKTGREELDRTLHNSHFRESKFLKDEYLNSKYNKFFR